jgi:putative aldouronate transport system permease protein
MRDSISRRVFLTTNYIFLIILACTCLFPFIHILAISLSRQSAVAAGEVVLWPVQFTVASYDFVLHKTQFWTAMIVTVKRVLLGSIINMFLSVLSAYALSKEENHFKYRNIYVWFFILTILFNGGLIPLFMVTKSLYLLDSIWALVLPFAVPVFNIVLLMNFFKTLPKALEEAAFIDGAGHWTILWKIYIPTSTAGIATVSLFCLVWHWNEWFSGMIFMNSPEHYPLQTYLQSVIISVDLTRIDLGQAQDINQISNRTFKAAQVFLGALPILCVYPFLQKYFTKGIILGSVKG